MTATIKPALALLIAAGCGTSISSTVINPSPRPLTPRRPESVQIFSSGPPPRPHVDVAYLEAEQQTDLSLDGTADFIAKLRRHAAALGCDGVVIGGNTNHATGSIIDYHVPVSLRGMTATCIVYVPEPGELDDMAAHQAAVTQVATTAYGACQQQRIEILHQVQVTPRAADRGKLLKQLPSCIKPESGQ